MRLGWAGLLMVGACVGAPGPALEATQAAAGLQPFCVGRYDIGVPMGAAVRGRDAVVNHMNVRRHGRAAEVEGASGSGTAREQVAPDTVLVTRTVTEYGVTDVDSIALRTAAGSVFEVSGQHDAPDGIAAQRAAALAIAAALEPAPPAKGGAGFCVDGGIVHRGFEWQESTTVVFDLPPGDLPGGDLIVETASNGRTTPDSLLDRAPGFLGSVMMDVDVLRSGRRDAGGHAGEELVMRSADGGLLLMWGTPGAPMSGEAPSIRIQLALRGADPDAALAAWDAILGSFARHRAP
jgi:hypothetical protein